MPLFKSLFIAITRFCLLFVVLCSQSALADKLVISTDIAPVSSLVKMLVGERHEVQLLISSQQSPHHFSLKPSKLKVLRESDLVVAVSAEFAPGLTRYFGSIVGDSNLLYLIPDAAQASGDQHAWLSPKIAIEWLAAINTQLIEIDQENAAFYQLQFKQAEAKLLQLQQSLHEQLSVVRDKTFIVHHDAYTHFAAAFNLPKPEAIASSDATAAGAATVKRLQKLAGNADCLLNEAQHNDAIVNTVSDGLNINRGTLDPLGSALSVDETLYPLMLQNIATALIECA